MVDENGAPVEDARVGGAGWSPHGNTSGVHDFTDENGMVVLEGRTMTDFGGTVTKEGYYKTWYSHVFREGSESGRWNPWPLKKTLVLKSIKNPIPMYARKVKAIVPVLDQPVGYDLEKGDWVIPHGKGTVEDFIFTVSGDYGDWTNRRAEMSVTFSNELDGIKLFTVQKGDREQRSYSTLISDHEAPLNVYSNIYEYERHFGASLSERKNMSQRKGHNAYFRVRTKIDEDGNIISANYGKLYDDLYCFFLRDSKKIGVSFTYYFNPDGTRNVEFDPDENLFPYDQYNRDPMGGTTLIQEP